MTLPSFAIYSGAVRHRRTRDIAHAFRVPVLYWMLDPENPEAFLQARPWWARGRLGPAHFRRADYLGPAEQSLGEAVRDAVHSKLGFRPTGPLRMVTQLRCFGFVFNPVTFYWCMSDDGKRTEAVVAEITNTPWGERHTYVLDGRGKKRGPQARFQKRFHISPFLPMEQEHDWRFSSPGGRVAVHMVNRDSESLAHDFDATLVLQRQPDDARGFASALIRNPWMPMRILIAIYWQALRLWLKRAPFHSHPNSTASHEPRHSH